MESMVARAETPTELATVNVAQVKYDKSKKSSAAHIFCFKCSRELSKIGQRMIIR